MRTCEKCREVMHLVNKCDLPAGITDEYPTYQCDNCGGMEIVAHFEDHMDTITDSMRADGGSADGEYEVAVMVREDGAQSSRERRPRLTGDAGLVSNASSPERFRSSKSDEELAAVEKVRMAYNAVHGKSFTNVEAEVNVDHEVDVWLVDGFYKVGFQVTKLDAAPWADLAKSGSFTADGPLEDELHRLMQTIKKKQSQSGKGVNLVLDAWRVVPMGVLDTFVKYAQPELEKLSYDEIWYAEPGGLGRVRRLYPPHAEADDFGE